MCDDAIYYRSRGSGSIGDCPNQLLRIGFIVPTGEGLTRDISDRVMLKSCVGGARLTLTESKRSDQVLFDWYS